MNHFKKFFEKTYIFLHRYNQLYKKNSTQKYIKITRSEIDQFKTSKLKDVLPLISKL